MKKVEKEEMNRKEKSRERIKEGRREKKEEEKRRGQRNGGEISHKQLIINALAGSVFL